MADKIRKIFDKIIKPDNRIKVFVAIGIVGILLLLLSGMMPKNTTTNAKETPRIDYSDYIDDLENRTSDIISSISGVGDCKVMITLQQSEESVYAENSDEKINDSSISRKSEYVLYDGGSTDEPILIKEYYPVVQGVVVVCDGGDNVSVQEKITDCISSLYNIPSTKISVSKLKG